jgi:hypothetical protein
MDALRAAAMKPHSTASLGGGFPDLVVGFRGINVMLEIKDGSKVLSAQSLTADEKTFHATWPGQVSVVSSAEEAISAVVAEAKKAGVL